MSDLVARKFPADPRSLFPVREFIRGAATEMELPRVLTEELELAISEACSMVLRHSLDPVISLSWKRDADQIFVIVENSDLLHPSAAQQSVSPL